MDYTYIIYFAVLIAVFFFLIIRPERKRKKQAQEMRDNLKVGTEVTTIGGIVGEIVNIDGEFITLETGEDRVRIQVVRWAIGSIGKSVAEK